MIESFVSKQERQKAIIGPCDKITQNLLKIVNQYFEPLEKPEPGEWLAQNPSEGQSFKKYLSASHNKIQPNNIRKVIYILPLDKQIQKNFLFLLKQYCLAFYYPLKVQILDPAPHILQKVKSRKNCGKRQYHAGQMLSILKMQLKKNAFCMMAVTIQDIYNRQSWNYVFGLASLDGRTGVFSFARHDNRFYGDQKYQIDYQIILWKSIGTLVHQIGHMFGIKHCIYYKCIMNGSNGPVQIAMKPLQLCPICLKKLQSNIKFSILTRYKAIKQFFDKNSQLLNDCGKKVNSVKKMIDDIIEKVQNNQEQFKAPKQVKQPVGLQKFQKKIQKEGIKKNQQNKSKKQQILLPNNKTLEQQKISKQSFIEQLKKRQNKKIQKKVIRK